MPTDNMGFEKLNKKGEVGEFEHIKAKVRDLTRGLNAEQDLKGGVSDFPDPDQDEDLLGGIKNKAA